MAARELNKFNISTHVLDTNKGRPVANLPITLYALKTEAEWSFVHKGKTTENGRLADFSSTDIINAAGKYKLRFEVMDYYSSTYQKSFYPYIDIIFEIDNVNEHYHIPLLLSAFGYVTYRGS